MMAKVVRSVLAGLLVGVGSAACVSVEYGIELEEDLSGTMDFSVAFDPDQMAYAMASMQRTFQGTGGAPTEEELEAARKDVTAQLENQQEEVDLDDIRQEASEDLPEGVEFVDAAQSDDGLRTEVTFRFDHLRRLSEMEVTPEADTADSGSSPTVRPFSGLTFQDEGDTFLLTNTPVDPLEQARSEGSPMQGMESQMKMMAQSMGKQFSGPMVTFSLTAPFEVVEHNATRVDGETLYWEYGLDSFMEQDEPGSIRVRYRKP